MKKIRILHLEDMRTDAEIIERELRKANLSFELLWVTNRKDFQTALKNFNPDLIISDHSLPGFDSVEALHLTRIAGLSIPFIIVTSTMSEEFAVNSMKRGVTDYLLKDRLTRLPIAVISAMELWNAEKEKKEYHDAIILNEKRFRAIIENNDDLISMMDENGQFIYVSPSLIKKFGYTEEECLGMKAFDVIHPDDAPIAQQFIGTVLSKHGVPMKAPLIRNLKKDGTYIWVSGTITNLLHAEGVYAIVSNFTDITDKKNAEEQVQKSEANLKAIIENTDAFIYSLDRNFNYITFNSALKKTLYELYGLDIKPGDKVFDFLEKIDLEETKEWERIYSKAFEGGTTHFIKEFKGDGYHNFSSFSINPIGENEKVIGLSCFVQDITKQKLNEEKLIKSEIEIRNFAKHINTVLEDERAHIAREIHDELGQKLVGIKIGLSTYRKSDMANDTLNEWVTTVLKDVNSTLQSLKRISTELRPGILDTLGLVPSIEWLVKEFEKKSKIKCHILKNVEDEKFGKEISTCFFRICQESLTNILKHAEASEVVVQVDQKNKILTLKISDNGKGIKHKKLHDPFSIGLLGMRERANIIGAEFEVQSKINSGTTILLKSKIK